MNHTNQQTNIEGFRLDLRNQRLEHQGRIVDLRPKSWALLKYMAARPQQLLGKDELVQAVWGGTVVTEASLNQVVRELRKALGDDARSPRYIETVHRRGFRFLLGADQPQNNTGTETEISLRPRLFGRNPELERLQHAAELAAAGHSQCCFVTGEPGIGKTSLVREFLETLTAQEEETPFLIGYGQCIDQHGEGEAYLPILEALDRLARGPRGAAVRAHLEHYAPMWLVQMPWLLPADHSYDALLVAATPAQMLREFCVFLEALAIDTPLILWLEDLHWTDDKTTDLLQALARRQETARLLVIVSYRPVDAAILGSPVRSLKQSLLQQQRASELELELLRPAGVGEYLSARFENIRNLPELTTQIYELSDGNPLFMVSLVDYLVTHDLLSRNQREWAVKVPMESIRESLPESLKGIIELQQQHLTENEALVLETASVLGTQFPALAVARMLGLELEAVELTCDQLAGRLQFLTAAGCVDWPDNNVSQCYQFIHDIYRRVLYDSLLPARCQRLHQSAGLVIEGSNLQQVDEVSAELALHFELGHDPERAIIHLRLAAERARQRAAAAEAVAYLNRALAQVAVLPGSTANEKIELELRLRLMRSLITATAYTAESQQNNLARALELSERLDDCASELQLLAQQCASLVLQGDIGAAERTVTRAKRTAERVDDPILKSHEALASGLCALMRAELESAEAHFGRCSDLLAGADLRKPTSLFGHDPAVLALGYSTISIWLLGRPEEARRRAQLALRRAEAIGVPQVRVNGLDVALTVEHLRRDTAATRSLAIALDACMDKYCVKYPYPRPLCARNWLLLASGNAAAALSGMQRDIKMAQAAGVRLFLPLAYITLSEACIAMDTTAAGFEAMEKAFKIIDAGERVLEAEAWRLKGELLRLENEPGQAEQCFRTALEVASNQSALALELRAATSLGELHRDTGQAPDAAERLQAIIDRFTEGFDTADFRQAAALAAALTATKTA